MSSLHKLNLTNQETETTIDILEKAITLHQEWLNQLHESLICGTPLHSDVYKQDAHRHCKLGQWYYSHAPNSLRSLDEFDRLEKIHTRMHDAARLLAETTHNGETIAPADYAEFYQNQQQLVQLLSHLRDRLIETSYSFDPLTGVFNRYAFYMIADKEHALAERRRESYIIAMIDLDHFKKVNDRFGHLVGDQVLRITADLFQQRLRNSDIFCRFGGEEFIAFLPGTRLQDASALFNAILQELAQTPIDTDNDDSFQVTTSIGLASHRQGQSLEEVIEQADAQLYEAKHQGRNRLCHSKSSA